MPCGVRNVVAWELLSNAFTSSSVARQQTTATLTNDTEAKQKATEAVLAALSKAGIEVVRATDEEVKALLSNSHATTLRTPQGTIYGWSVNGKIYLTEAGLNPDTPIHEYTHLWAEAMMIKNKQGWNSIKISPERHSCMERSHSRPQLFQHQRQRRCRYK